MFAKSLLASALFCMSFAMNPSLAQEDTAAEDTTPATEQSAPAPAAAQAMTEAEMAAVHAQAKYGDPERGEAKAATCAACHGVDGNSALDMYPKIAGQVETYVARQLALFKTKERDNAIMYPFASALSPQDMRDLGAYFSRQKVQAGLADEALIQGGKFDGMPFYQAGQTLYRGGDADRGIPACIACHGPTGVGNPGSAYPSLAGQHESYTATRLQAFRDGLVSGEGSRANVIMSQVAEALTDNEIQALATYLQGLHANPLPDAGVAATSKKGH